MPLELKADGTINGNASHKWTYQAPWLEINRGNGAVDKVYVERERDWENKKPCLIFTGLTNQGEAVWGKK